MSKTNPFSIKGFTRAAKIVMQHIAPRDEKERQEAFALVKKHFPTGDVYGIQETYEAHRAQTGNGKRK